MEFITRFSQKMVLIHTRTDNRANIVASYVTLGGDPTIHIDPITITTNVKVGTGVGNQVPSYVLPIHSVSSKGRGAVDIGSVENIIQMITVWWQPSVNIKIFRVVSMGRRKA